MAAPLSNPTFVFVRFLLFMNFYSGSALPVKPDGKLGNV
jgi:hypothetical protein